MPSDAPGARPELTGYEQHPAFRGPTLGARIAMVAIAAAVLAVVVAAVVSYPLARDAALRESATNLEHNADSTAIAIERSVSRYGDLIPDKLAAVLNAESISAYYVPPGGRVPDGLTASDLDALQSGQPISGERTTVDGEQELVAARALSNGGAVVLTQPVTVTSRLAVATLARFGFALAVGVLFAAIFGLTLARRLTRPLRNAARAAEQLTKGDRDVALEVEGPPEIAEITIALTDLQHALAQSEGRQRDFLLSVSHELRTPLTAIRGYAEAIADGVVPPADFAKTGTILQSESDRLDRLVADLLELARLDAVDVPIAPVPVDFTELGSEAAEVWRARCAHEGLSFRSELPQHPLLGVTDPIRVRQIIDNLCANALRVTPAGQIMVIAIRPFGNADIEVEVRDGGPGLTADDCAVAFEPAELYSRYRGIRKVGSGVGLALVGRLARRLGGSAEAGSAPEGGARFTIRIARTIES